MSNFIFCITSQIKFILYSVCLYHEESIFFCSALVETIRIFNSANMFRKKEVRMKGFYKGIKV